MRRVSTLIAKLVAAHTLALSVSVAVSPSADASAAQAERLVRAAYFEGMPYIAAEQLSIEGVARLIEMLDEPGEFQHRARILLALGIRGGPGVLQAIEQFAEAEPEGELSFDEYKARLVAPVALGHLARRDPRALRLLRRWSRGEASVAAPRWQHGRYRGERLASRLREAAITGLAVSGRPEARRLLVELSSDQSVAANAPLARHRSAALSRFDQIEAEGLDRTLRRRRD